jgi:hypothetical protein
MSSVANDPIPHPTTREMQRFLPRELHSAVWYDLEDPTALEVGNVLFHAASWAYYSGKVININTSTRTIEIEWYKHHSENPVRETFFSYSVHKWKDILWIDPALCE